MTTVALDLGYENPAAFTTMFKRVFGRSPLVYLGLRQARRGVTGGAAGRSSLR